LSIEITGTTKLAGIVGWPLDHTLSPPMHNAAYESLGLDWVYIPLPVQDEGALIRTIKAMKVLPFVGFNVTMPYKAAVMSLCDEVAAIAELAGAVNTVHVVDGRLIGYNTDGRGLLYALEQAAGFLPEGKHAAVLGAGGAAGAAIVSLVLGRAAKVDVINRTLDRASQLVERIQPRVRESELTAFPMGPDAQKAVSTADIVINATSLGMNADDESPVPASWLNKGQLVVDMIYRADDTTLLKHARSKGATAIGGLGMLVSQAALAMDIWAGTEYQAPYDVMYEVAERMIGKQR